MSAKEMPYQIVRKDGRNCFVESLSDAFNIGKVHLVFASYDLNKPAGERQTDIIPIYVDVAEWLELARKFESGEMRRVLKSKKEAGDKTPIKEWLGGTAAARLQQFNKARSDGMSLSRTAKMLCGNKTDFLLVADSGPGEENEKGLIVPRFGGKPENHVAISLSWDAMSELVLITKAHYEAWLTAQYVAGLNKKHSGT